MANWETLQVNTENMEPGKFYQVFTDSNGTTLTIEKSDKKIEFVNKKYIEVEVSNTSIIEVFEQLSSENPAVNRRITDGVQITIRENIAIIEMSQNLTGYVLIR